MTTTPFFKTFSHPDKARIGAIGENMVISKLMQFGWDAFNVNGSIKNFKSIDIVCLNSKLPESAAQQWKPKTSLIQVKTSVQKNITAGFSIGDCLDKEKLESEVKGPYVFLKVEPSESGDWEFRYFILSRTQFIDLLYASNQWYFNDWEREKEISKTSPAGLEVDWLIGKDVEENKRHKSFANPLKGSSCEDCWENIWKD